ncbi:MAG TPA: histidine kinase [Solirubrobacteraceae bacterium]|nr:histidine kinase [Solirubrobacteraceae bacterium]
MTVSALRRVAAPGGRRALWLDGALAAAVLAASLAHTHRDGTLGIVLDVALVAPLLARRRAPLAVFGVIWAVAAVQGLVERPTLAVSALLIAFYTVATGSDRRRTLLAALALELGIVLTAITTSTGVESAIRIVVALSGLATAAGVLGVNLRNRRLVVSGLRERAERLEREREQEVALARVTERSRIAREMHDVVAHNLSVMVALCDGAAYQIRDAPERVEAALEQASRTGRQALGEMRHLLGVLRESPDGPDLAPQPGLRQIEDLVEQIRHAGVPVSYTLSGAMPTAPAGLELALYRIVQEALTNTLKHAGEGATAEVTLRCGEERVDVAIRDTGASPAPPNGSGGSGLRGMRERAAVYGGSLHAGPRAGGGWEVRASLAVPATAPAPAPAAAR